MLKSAIMCKEQVHVHYVINKTFATEECNERLWYTATSGRVHS